MPSWMAVVASSPMPWSAMQSSKAASLSVTSRQKASESPPSASLTTSTTSVAMLARPMPTRSSVSRCPRSGAIVCTRPSMKAMAPKPTSTTLATHIR